MKNYLTERNNNFDMGFNLFDNMFDEFFKPVIYKPRHEFMRTDIKELDVGYELSIDLAGYNKEDLSLTLNDGYLTISATKNAKEECENKYICKERTESCSRSYFVGKSIIEEDIKAKYNNGVLTVIVPKKEQTKPEKKIISID